MCVAHATWTWSVRAQSLLEKMAESPFKPPRELSTMLTFNATEDLNEPLTPRKPLWLISHHDGDVGHPPRDKIDRSDVEAKEKFKKMQLERSYKGAAGLGRGLADAAKPEGELVPTPPQQPRRFQPRLSAKQKADMAEASAHFAKDQATLDAMPKYGAPSSKLQPKFSYFNILYAHPMNGAMPTWGDTGTNATDPYKVLLPPVNSLAGASIPPYMRRAAKVNWGWPRDFPPQDVPQNLHATSPSKHCTPSRPLPRTKGVKVHASTNPWLRQPPHTAHKKQIYQAMYGPSPEQKEREAASLRMQSMQRGRSSRKAKVS